MKMTLSKHNFFLPALCVQQFHCVLYLHPHHFSVFFSVLAFWSLDDSFSFNIHFVCVVCVTIFLNSMQNQRKQMFKMLVSFKIVIECNDPVTTPFYVHLKKGGGQDLMWSSMLLLLLSSLSLDAKRTMKYS